MHIYMHIYNCQELLILLVHGSLTILGVVPMEFVGRFCLIKQEMDWDCISGVIVDVYIVYLPVLLDVLASWYIYMNVVLK